MSLGSCDGKYILPLNSQLKSWNIRGLEVRGIILVEQELLTRPQFLSSPPVFSGVRVTRSLVLCVRFVDRYLSFFPLFFFFAIVMSVLRRLTASDHIFGTLQTFLMFAMFFLLSVKYIYLVKRKKTLNGRPMHNHKLYYNIAQGNRHWRFRRMNTAPSYKSPLV